MKVFLLTITAIMLSLAPAISQDSLSLKEKEISYNNSINTRAEKIVATLQIANVATAAKVKNIIASEYKNLNSVYTLRDLQIKTAKEQSDNNKETLNKQLTTFRDEATAKTDALHKSFLSQLSQHLTAQQIDQVKDGLTYNVVHVTYNGYNQMIPNLTEEQKKQIMVWLVEAREHSMDAESSEKKHAWFGKYKGRINNYLSAAGYDLRKEGEEWQVRIKEAADKKKTTN
ncbi:MAG: hypothetical protein JWP81_1696 [Ferruginibacter sp.]|nr:hypothetical protein [Ferruginibacter sp.]